MIKFHSHVRVVGVDNVCSEGGDFRLKLYFNTQNTIIYPKPIMDILFMFNGFFTSHDISSSNFGHKGIDSNNIIRILIDYGIVSEFAINPSIAEGNNRFFIAQKCLQRYTVHFHQVSNVNIMLAMLLQKLQTNCVFYTDSLIDKRNISGNIYFECSDIGKPLSTILVNKIGAKNIQFDSFFDKCTLLGDAHIFVNSDPLNWVDSEKYIVINAWDYDNSYFEDSCLFNAPTIDVSGDLRQLIKDYISAVRAIDDMVYSIMSGVII